MAVLERVKQVLGLERSTAEASWWTLGIAGVGLSTACWMGSSLWGNPILAEDNGLFVAQADDDENDRPRPPRDDDRPDGPPPPRGPRGEGPPDGPRDGGPREGGPRDGGAREHGPRDEGPRGRGPREEGPHGPGPRDGAPRPPHPPGPHHADHGPGREHGHHEGRPTDKLTADFVDAFRKLEEEGPEGKRKQHEILAQLIRAMHHGDHLIPAPPPGGPMIHRFEFATGPDSRPRPDAEPQPRMLPPPEALQDVHHAMRELRREVDRLRDEMAHLRHEAGEGPRHPREGGPHHPGEGGHRHPGEPGPRHRGNAEPPRGRPGRPEEGPRPPRDGERGPRPPRVEDRTESDTPREEAVPVKPAAKETAPRDDQTTAEEAPISASTVEADE